MSIVRYAGVGEPSSFGKTFAELDPLHAGDISQPFLVGGGVVERLKGVRIGRVVHDDGEFHCHGRYYPDARHSHAGEARIQGLHTPPAIGHGQSVTIPDPHR